MLLADFDWNHALELLLAALTAIVLGWLQMRTSAAVTASAKVTEAVHVLVNSAMSNALEVGARALRRVADLSKHTTLAAVTEAEAEAAEQKLAQHEARQAVVDAGGTLPLEPAKQSPLPPAP